MLLRLFSAALSLSCWSAFVIAQSIDAKVSAPVEASSTGPGTVIEIGKDRFYALKLEKAGKDSPRGTKLGELTCWSLDEMVKEYSVTLALPTSGATTISLHEAVEDGASLMLYYSFAEGEKRRIMARVELDDLGVPKSDPAIIMELPVTDEFWTIKDPDHGTIAILKKAGWGSIASQRFMSFDRSGDQLLDVTVEPHQIRDMAPIAAHVDAQGTIYLAGYTSEMQGKGRPEYFLVSCSAMNGARSWTEPTKTTKQSDIGPFAFVEDGEHGVHLIHAIGDGAGIGNSGDITGYKAVSFSSLTGDRVGSVRHLLKGSLMKKAKDRPAKTHRIEWVGTSSYFSNSDGTIDIVGTQQHAIAGTTSLWKVVLHPEKGIEGPIACRYTRTYKRHMGMIGYRFETFRTHWVRIGGSTHVVAQEFKENIGRSCASTLPWKDVSATNGKATLASAPFDQDGLGIWSELGLGPDVPGDATPTLFQRGGPDGRTYVVQLYTDTGVRWLRLR